MGLCKCGFVGFYFMSAKDGISEPSILVREPMVDTFHINYVLYNICCLEHNVFDDMVDRIST